VLVHGGSWCGGSRAFYGIDPARNATRLARQGFVVAAIDYQRATPSQPNWPVAVADVQQAVAWLIKHAQDFAINPQQIVLMGQSAGAHLALMAAMLAEPGQNQVAPPRQVAAVISFYGPTDLEKLEAVRRLDHDPVRRFVGLADLKRAEAHGSDLRLLRAASPLFHIGPQTPPILLLHGNEDSWVPASQSIRMAEALRQAGVPSQLILVEGARHGFETIVEAPTRRDLLPEILAFLDRLGIRTENLQ
jgi:acetyl esterase/lipase